MNPRIQKLNRKTKCKYTLTVTLKFQNIRCKEMTLTVIRKVRLPPKEHQLG